MKRSLFLIATLPLALAACATPREQCINRETSEYRTVTNLLSEVEANLDRGYAWEEYEVENTRLVRCDREAIDKDGNKIIIPDTCWENQTETKRRRIVIDPAPETRKRDNLRARQAALMSRAKAAVEACKIAYPEDK